MRWCSPKRRLPYESAARLRNRLGAALGSFEAALLLRGLRTLHYACAINRLPPWPSPSTLPITPRLLACSTLDSLSHPGHAIAARQMLGGFGGMLSMRIRGGQDAAISTAGRMKVWKRATSLGGVESLVEHRSSIEGPGSSCPLDLLRFSVGLEDLDDLIGDIEGSLAIGCKQIRTASASRSLSVRKRARVQL